MNLFKKKSKTKVYCRYCCRRFCRFCERTKNIKVAVYFPEIQDMDTSTFGEEYIYGFHYCPYCGTEIDWIDDDEKEKTAENNDALEEK